MKKTLHVIAFSSLLLLLLALTPPGYKVYRDVAPQISSFTANIGKFLTAQIMNSSILCTDEQVSLEIYLEADKEIYDTKSITHYNSGNFSFPEGRVLAQSVSASVSSSSSSWGGFSSGGSVTVTLMDGSANKQSVTISGGSSCFGCSNREKSASFNPQEQATGVYITGSRFNSVTVNYRLLSPRIEAQKSEKFSITLSNDDKEKNVGSLNTIFAKSPLLEAIKKSPSTYKNVRITSPSSSAQYGFNFPLNYQYTVSGNVNFDTPIHVCKDAINPEGQAGMDGYCDFRQCVVAQCSDGQDNDNDQTADAAGALIDGIQLPADRGCEGDPNKLYEGNPPACRDGLDNDGDGTADLNGAVIEEKEYPPDLGCADSEDNDEVNPPQCSDKHDNDDPEDEVADFPNDPGCNSANDNDETNPECFDGVDNDGDGKIDFTGSVDSPPDPDCVSTKDEIEAGPLGEPQPKEEEPEVVEVKDLDVLMNQYRQLPQAQKTSERRLYLIHDFFSSLFQSL